MPSCRDGDPGSALAAAGPDDDPMRSGKIAVSTVLFLPDKSVSDGSDIRKTADFRCVIPRLGRMLFACTPIRDLRLRVLILSLEHHGKSDAISEIGRAS